MSEPCLTCLQDVCDIVLPLAPSMQDRDIADLLRTIHADPSSGEDLLAAYKAADATVSPSVWSEVWLWLTRAATVASVISSIAAPIQTLTSL